MSTIVKTGLLIISGMGYLYLFITPVLYEASQPPKIYKNCKPLQYYGDDYYRDYTNKKCIGFFHDN